MAHRPALRCTILTGPVARDTGGEGLGGLDSAILDHRSAHRAPDVLLFALAYPRWEFVYRPTYAA